MHSAPRVSVIIPVFNLARYLPEAIESVLGQTVPADARELIVVDDGSTDESAAVAARYGEHLRCVRQANRGLSAARNTGLRIASGTYVGFLDADDRWHAEKLSLEMQVLDQRPNVDVVHSGWRYVDEWGKSLPQIGWPRLDGIEATRFLIGNALPVHALLLRRHNLDAVGWFDETLTSAEDWDLWLRLSLTGARWACVDRVLADYRMRGHAMHSDTGRMLTNKLRVLDRAFDGRNLSSDLRGLAPVAYQNAYLAAACEYYARGQRVPGQEAFHLAVQFRPELLSSPRELRRLCRWLLPQGYQRHAVVVERHGELSRVLKQMLADVFARPGISRPIAALRRRAWLAYARTVLRLWRHRAIGKVRSAGSHG